MHQEVFPGCIRRWREVRLPSSPPGTSRSTKGRDESQPCDDDVTATVPDDVTATVPDDVTAMGPNEEHMFREGGPVGSAAFPPRRRQPALNMTETAYCYWIHI